MNNQGLMRLSFVAVMSKLLHAKVAVLSHAMDDDFNLKNMVDAYNILENASIAVANEFIILEMRIVRIQALQSRMTQKAAEIVVDEAMSDKVYKAEESAYFNE